MVPVNEVGSEGQPRLLVSNLPPVSTTGAPPIDPAHSGIYFGERPSSYVVVGAQQNEFDYPTGESDTEGSIGTETRWTGTTGIPLDKMLNRLLFAARFRDLDLLISDQVTASSQLLFHRSLSDRLTMVAPFLRFDKDPYVVIDTAGRMTYIQDAFTTSDRFPNAQAYRPAPSSGLGNESFDYIRNSVKITVDAYDGTMHFYVNDTNDPIIRAYQGVFPDLFEPLSSMPSDLKDHLRIPEDLFNVQTNMFGRYHVTNTQQFFGADDLWTVPSQTSEQTLPSEAYYVEMRLPNEKGVEFLLLQPMVPTGRPNMIAWVAARMDAPNYGQVQVYRFPADTTIFGPAQIEARIDQDPVISAQVSLWNQSGSNVIRGSLIVVPLDDSLIYLQPVYLQSTGSAFPEFKRIVVASPRQVVWADSLGEALRLLLAAEAGNAPNPSPGPTPQPTPNPSATPGPPGGPTAAPTSPPSVDLPADVPGLIDYANLHFALAQTALRDGDFGRYGAEIALVEAALQRLQVLAPELSSAERRPIGQSRPMTRGVTLGSGLLVTLATPATWPLALATFLLRGGIVLFVLPIVVLPTPVGIGNTFGPTLTALALGSVPAEAILCGGLAVAFGLLWLIGGGWLAAALEAEGDRDRGIGRRCRGDREGRSGSAARRRLGGLDRRAHPGRSARREPAAPGGPVVGGRPTRRRRLRRVDTPARRVDAARPARRAGCAGGGRRRSSSRGWPARSSGPSRRDGSCSPATAWPAHSPRRSRPACDIRCRSWPGSGSPRSPSPSSSHRPRSPRDRHGRSRATALDGAGDPLRDAVSVIALVFLWAVGLLLAAVDLRLARRHLDHRGGGAARDVRGVHRPPTG